MSVIKNLERHLNSRVSPFNLISQTTTLSKGRYVRFYCSNDWFFTRLKAHIADLELPFQVVDGKDWLTRKKLARAIVDKYFKGRK